MCGGMAFDPIAAEKRLSDLIEREMGIAISPPALRLFVRYHWRELTVLAHRIHESAEDAKARLKSMGDAPSYCPGKCA